MSKILVALIAMLFASVASAATTITSLSPNPVRIFHQLLVTGTGMSQVNAVYFQVPGGLVSPNFSLVDDQHLSVFVPSQMVGNATLRIDANFQLPLTSAPIQIKDDNDFTGDGRADFLLTNGNGDIFVWAVAGAIKGFGYLASVPPGTQFVGTGDFDGDNHSDILWRDANGGYGIWLVVSNSVVAAGGLPAVPAGTSFAGIGDIDGDGKDDIIWRDSAGGVGAWEMDGLNIKAGGYIGSAPTSLTLLAVAMFNKTLVNDTKADILWMDQNGGVGAWLLDGFTITGGTFIGNRPDVAATFEAARDFNGDGEAEVLWRFSPPGCQSNCQVVYTAWHLHQGNMTNVLKGNSIESSFIADPRQFVYHALGDVNQQFVWRSSKGSYGVEAAVDPPYTPAPPCCGQKPASNPAAVGMTVLN